MRIEITPGLGTRRGLLVLTLALALLLLGGLGYLGGAELGQLELLQ